MLKLPSLLSRIVAVFLLLVTLLKADAQQPLRFGNDKISLVLDGNKKAVITSLMVNGQEVIQDESGIFSGLRIKTMEYSSRQLLADPTIQQTKTQLAIKGIRYGNKEFTVVENWIFTLKNGSIQWDMDRTLSKSLQAEKISWPGLLFKSMDIWEGAFQDYGGLAWFYLFNKQRDTYGVHSSSSRFWNSKTGNGLTVSITAPGQKVAVDFSRTTTDKLAYTIALSSKEILPRFDSVTQRRRYVRDTTDVWAPIAVAAGTHHQQISFTPFSYEEKFGRGKMVGINGEQVSAVLNTIARIGVIDQHHFGGNSWHTPYGPICLHEQYIAQMGLGINDAAYLKGYRDCLDFYRDNAIKPDGRVWPRWAYSNEDAMPKAYTDKGFYEAQWGYLLDANPDFVTNVAELYDQIGDLKWVKTHQHTCEKALDWILQRDSNGNGLVEMVTDSHQQKRGSDWIDIIWAAYENAFVNAKLYRALVLWTEIERQLGNTAKEKYYREFASKLKNQFNKSTTEGGFWDEGTKCYIHWRDKDGSVHGNNMVTPVNFMAIAYGICEDPYRTKTILDDIETQMVKENLFFWPLCMYSYAPGEGNDWQFPFPNYENGDIFLSWGSVAVKAYASYKPGLALKYVRNVLAQYAKDGLAFQRYGRAHQDGLGDDILSGNSLSAVGLYQAIYGINPLYNRFYLDPHITPELAGTQLRYNYRNQPLIIGLAMDAYTVSDGRFMLKANSTFGFFSNPNRVSYFKGNSDKVSMDISSSGNTALEITIGKWEEEEKSWSQKVKAIGTPLHYEINGLKQSGNYSVVVNGALYKKVKSDENGKIVFNYSNKQNEAAIVIKPI